MKYYEEMIIIGNYLKRVLDVEFDIVIIEGLNVPSETDGSHIFVCKEWLENLEDDLEILAMLAHEAFHCFQIKAILDEILPPTLAYLWQDEFTKYQNPSVGIEEHWNQNIEKTATIFSDIVLYKLTNYHLNARNKFEQKDIDIVNSFNLKF